MNEIQQIIKQSLDETLSETKKMRVKIISTTPYYHFVEFDYNKPIKAKSFFKYMKANNIPMEARINIEYDKRIEKNVFYLVYDGDKFISSENMEKEYEIYFNNRCSSDVIYGLKSRGYYLIPNGEEKYIFKIFEDLESVYKLYLNKDYDKIENSIKKYLAVKVYNEKTK